MQKKNRHEPSPSYWAYRQAAPVIDRERPGRGYRHLLKKRDIERFIELLPDWEELSTGLDAVLLAAGSSTADGWYDDGVVAISAWEREIPRTWSSDACAAHAHVLRQIGVPVERTAHRGVRCHFTEATARAFQLTHVFLHELGHHHDRMTTRSQRGSARGEGFAERYAVAHGDRIWTRYCDAFDLGWAEKRAASLD